MNYNNNQYGRYESTANRIAGGVLIIIINLLCLLSLFNLLGGVGRIISSFIVGIFGLTSYAFSICGIVLGIAVTFGKRITLSVDKAFKYISLFLLGVNILQAWTTRGFIIGNGYGEYLRIVYKSSTPAGLISSLLLYPFMKLITPAFLLVVLIVLFFTTALVSFYPLLKGDVQYKTKKVKIKPTKTKTPVLTDIGKEGREEKIISSEVGSNLFVGTIGEGSSIPELKLASKRSSKKQPGFSLLFPNQANPLTDEDSIIEPIFDNDTSRKQRAREKLFGSKNNKNEKADKKSNIKTTSEIYETALDNSVQSSHRDINKSSLPFSFNAEVANSEMGRPKSLKDAFNIDKSEEAQIKDIQNRFSYILDKDLTPNDIRGAATKKLAEPASNKGIIQPEVEQFSSDNTANDEGYNNDNSLNDIPDDMPSFIRDILYNDRKIVEPSQSESTEPYIKPNEKGGNIDENQKGERGSIFDMNIFSNSDIKQSTSNDNADKQDKSKKDSLGNQKSVLGDIKSNIEAKDTEKASSYSNDFPVGKNAKSIEINSKHRKKSKSEQISIDQSLTEQRLRIPYMAPPVNLLLDRSDSIQAEDYSDRIKILERTLIEFKIDAKVIGVTQGPTFSRFELRMPVGVSVNQVLKLENDLAMKLKASPIRFEAPIPGRDAFGIEVPNEKRSIVGLRSIIASEEFNTAKSPLTFSLGKDIANDNYVCDLESMPHMLIAGATGTGKSVCINSLIISLLYKCGPNDLKLVLVDPKKVELSLYSGLPHLLLPEVIDEPEVAINALDWAIDEMRSRFNLFKKHQVRNITEYNKIATTTEGINKIPRVVFIIDELADFILVRKREIEERIGKITRLSRAAGIHLVVATQRPSVDIVTGTIKSNLPSRIAFAVKTSADSSTILGGGGAEKLLGKGDMLFAPQSLPEPLRLQGTLVERDEVKAVVDYIKNNNESFYDSEIENKIYAIKSEDKESSINSNDDSSNEGDSKLFIDALRMFVIEQQASISKLQRKFNVGYGTAANIIEEMEERKFVSPNKGGNRTRDVLISLEQFKEMYGQDDDEIEGA